MAAFDPMKFFALWMFTHDQADDLIGEVMRARGYPVGDFEQQLVDFVILF